MNEPRARVALHWALVLAGLALLCWGVLGRGSQGANLIAAAAGLLLMAAGHFVVRPRNSR